MDIEDGGEHCFICFEEDEPLFRVCDCNMVIHKHCFEKMGTVQLINSNHLQCSVCKHKFEQNVLSTSTKCSINILMCSCFSLCLVSLALTSIFIFYNIHLAAIPVFCSTLAAFVLYIYLQCLHRQQTGRFSWIIYSRSANKVEVKTKAFSIIIHSHRWWQIFKLL